MLNKQMFLKNIPTADVLVEICDEIKPDKENWFTVRCPNPEHDDKNPSCRVNASTQRFSCMSCEMQGDILTFIQLQCGFQRRNDAVEWVAGKYKLHSPKIFDPRLVKNYNERLLTSEELLKTLREKKGIHRETIEKYRLGYDGSRITIPIHDEYGHYVNVKRYLPGAKVNKYLSTKGYPTKLLYPVDQLEASSIIVTEGELKALLLIQHGYNAITATAGAKTWDSDWSGLFYNKTVYVVFDIDKTGKVSAQKIAISLVDAGAKEVKIIDLPLDSKKYPKGDITDFLVTEGHDLSAFRNLLSETPVFRPLSGRAVLLNDESIRDVSLAKIGHAEYTGKRVRASGIIQAKDRDEYIVPHRVRIDCKKDHTECAVCPVASNIDAGGEFDLNLEDLVTIQFIDKPTSAQTKIVRESLGIPFTCTKNTAIAIKTANVEDVRVIPEESLTNPNDDTLCRIFSIGHGLKANEKYTFNARVWPHPDTQAAVSISYHTEPAKDSLSNYYLQNGQLESLEIFKAERGKEQEKLDEIYEDLSQNVTQIYQRPLLHMFMDIVWHSALYLEFEGKTVKGWIDALIVGDPAQGKSEIAENLLHHYKTGTRIDTKGASVPGLLGVCEQIGSRWIVRWGKIPINDRRLVILEECKGMPVEVIAKLTDMRSSGIAEITKAGNQRTFARTRQLWISNPRDNTAIRGYNYGIQSVQHLIGAPEDVRRFDMAMCVATGEISSELLNQPKNRPENSRPRFGSDLCHSLILWCWSRKPAEIHFSDATITELYAVTKRMAQRYSASIPLVEPADQRYKIARISAAIAGRLFSTTDGVNLQVLPEHTKLCESFLCSIYDSQVMGYDQFSNAERSSIELLNGSEITKTIRELGSYQTDFINGCLRQNFLSQSDLMDLTGGDRDEAKEMIGMLVRNNALQRIKLGYKKSPKFIELLRSLADDEPESSPFEEQF